MIYEFKELPSNLKPIFVRIKKQRTFGDVLQEAFDTETNSKGDVIVLCSSRASTGPYPDFRELLDFLWRESKQLNWFFNLRFDLDAVLKQMFRLKHGEYLMLHNEKVLTIDYGPYEIEAASYKMFTLKKNREVREFWDLSNFLSGSLDYLSQKYLGESKSGKDFDKNRMEHYDFGAVKAYCVHDCALTKKLAEFLNTKIELVSESLLGNKRSPSAYYSKASLAEFYAIELVDLVFLQPFKKMSRSAIPVLRDAYRSYHGGMFQVFNRGLLQGTKTFDINSAYPYEIMRLKALDGEWITRKNDFDLKSDYGIYRVRQRFCGWSPVKIAGRTYYPVTRKMYENYINKPELEYLIKTKEDFEVLHGYEHVNSSGAHPFQQFILELYDCKSGAKEAEDESLYWLYKVVMNSLYGKFVQTSGDRAGKLFNPIYGAEITARTRLKVWDVGQQLERLDYIATDSITGIGNLKVDVSERLGSWSCKTNKDMVLIQNGLSLEKLDGKWVFKNSRGFSRYQTTEFKLDKEYLTVKSRKVFHLIEALRRHKVWDTNKFLVAEKKFELNGLDVRIWLDDFSTKKLIKSVPYGDELFG